MQDLLLNAAEPDVTGQTMHAWASDLFPICRSLTGPGVRETLGYLQELLPELRIRSVPSGTQVFDWTVPNEWTIRDAYLASEAGERIIDFRDCNLHVVGYSIPVDRWLTLDELQPHLHSLPDQPDAIPYVTSFYAPAWGFCLADRQRRALPAGRYRAVIDSDLAPGVLNYGELILPGREPSEVLLSTNICHPSLANNELSGPVVLAALARWLLALPERRHTYRIVFLPETIGAIAYLSAHLDQMKAATIAGFVITCVGDERSYSYMPSRNGATLADRVVQHVLTRRAGKFTRHSFLERGSDERQYCSPGVDLPVCSLMRTKYGTYPEYHTSLDDLSLITPAGLQGSYDALRACLAILEANRSYRLTTLCEPQLGKRGLYPSLSAKEAYGEAAAINNVVAYADGTLDLVQLAEAIDGDALACAGFLERLERAGLVEVV